jgi:hypothetical protein
LQGVTASDGNFAVVGDDDSDKTPDEDNVPLASIAHVKKRSQPVKK